VLQQCSCGCSLVLDERMQCIAMVKKPTGMLFCRRVKSDVVGVKKDTIFLTFSLAINYTHTNAGGNRQQADTVTSAQPTPY
jgi:hypothetical protein